MIKRTPEQKQQNVFYQLRHRKKRKLELKGSELLQLVNTEWPIGVDSSLIRRITMRIEQAMRLPYRWTDKDLARAYKALDKLKKEFYSEEPEAFTHEYHVLLICMMDAFQHIGGTADERVKVALKVMIQSCGSMKKLCVQMVDLSSVSMMYSVFGFILTNIRIGFLIIFV